VPPARIDEPDRPSHARPDAMGSKQREQRDEDEERDEAAPGREEGEVHPGS
jgi:hypothetical protein